MNLLTTGQVMTLRKLERCLTIFKIPDVFAQIVTIHDLDDMAHAKPHSYIAQKIMETQGVKPEETVLVGDAQSDMQMAWTAAIFDRYIIPGRGGRLGIKLLAAKQTKASGILMSRKSEPY